MNSNKYFKELEKNLRDMDKKRKNEILKELKAIAGDDDYEKLLNRFGKPKDMAENYLENYQVKKRSKSRYFLYFLLFLVVVFVGLYLAIKAYLKDPFDYSKYNASTIDKMINKQWHSLDDVDKIDISQSKVVVYFSTKDSFEYTCDDKTIKKENKTFFINQAHCYVKIPKKSFNIKTNQSNVVLVKPLEELSLDIQQSSIELATKEENYNFIMKNNEGYLGDFSSNKNGVKINVKLYQSSFDRYEY